MLRLIAQTPNFVDLGHRLLTAADPPEEFELAEALLRDTYSASQEFWVHRSHQQSVVKPIIAPNHLGVFNFVTQRGSNRQGTQLVVLAGFDVSDLPQHQCERVLQTLNDLLDELPDLVAKNRDSENVQSQLIYHHPDLKSWLDKLSSLVEPAPDQEKRALYVPRELKRFMVLSTILAVTIAVCAIIGFNISHAKPQTKLSANDQIPADKSASSKENPNKAPQKPINGKESAERKKKEEEKAKQKRQEEEKAKQKRQEEEKAKQKRQEEAEAERKRQEEEKAKQKRQEEEKAKQKRQEEAEAKQKRQEEEERKRKEEEAKQKRQKGEERKRKEEKEAEQKRQKEEEDRKRQEVAAEQKRQKVEEERKRKEEEEAEQKRKQKNEERAKKIIAEAKETTELAAYIKSMNGSDGWIMKLRKLDASNKYIEKLNELLKEKVAVYHHDKFRQLARKFDMFYREFSKETGGELQVTCEKYVGDCEKYTNLDESVCNSDLRKWTNEVIKKLKDWQTNGRRPRNWVQVSIAPNTFDQGESKLSGLELIITEGGKELEPMNASKPTEKRVLDRDKGPLKFFARWHGSPKGGTQKTLEEILKTKQVAVPWYKVDEATIFLEVETDEEKWIEPLKQELEKLKLSVSVPTPK